ncbi:MAG: Rpn family recombination-promoting nuclease/putative transposase, partial [Clostridia bacterium]|nr:Rpn family recombination-promoting nuclease/putative transposase [Clostridia bacterium]
MKETTVKKLPLTSDIVFKRVFAKEGNEDILKSLLEAILEISIQKLIVKNPEIPRNLYDQKASILDIKVEIDQNTICDIEIQVKDLKNIKRRSTYYMARLFSDDLKKGEDYKKIKNTIVINLLNFETYHRNSYHNIAHLKFEKTKEEEKVDMGYEQEEEIASKELEMHFIEIPKFIKKDPEAKTKLEKWLWLLAGREDKLEMAKKKDEDIKKAMDIIEEMSMDEKEWDLCRAREIAILDYNTGILEAKEEGEERGERKKQLEIAKKML